MASQAPPLPPCTPFRTSPRERNPSTGWKPGPRSQVCCCRLPSTREGWKHAIGIHCVVSLESQRVAPMLLEVAFAVPTYHSVIKGYQGQKHHRPDDLGNSHPTGTPDFLSMPRRGESDRLTEQGECSEQLVPVVEVRMGRHPLVFGVSYIYVGSKSHTPHIPSSSKSIGLSDAPCHLSSNRKLFLSKSH
jgi:hypothetical protein